MGSALSPTRSTYLGLFLVTLATLMFEVLLTRIFSVTMWYHFAFMVISIALFGLTVGAIVVYLYPDRFPSDTTSHNMALSSLLFSIAIVASFLFHITMRFSAPGNLVGVLTLLLTYLVVSIPFFFSGICVTLALTRHSGQVSRLYAADLAGAAAGSILVIAALEITDGPTAVFLVSFIASLGAFTFTFNTKMGRIRQLSALSALLIGLFAIGHTFLVNNQAAVLRITWVKGGYEAPPLYEKWNSFSRIHVEGDPVRLEFPKSDGISSLVQRQYRVRQLLLKIDAGAATLLTAYDGSLEPLAYLKSDVANLAHFVREDASVLIVGSGGGRDILSAFVFDQNEIVAVELNQDITDAVNQHFGEFTGHLDRDPRVKFINDEARSYLERSPSQYDILQLSLIDTWAATAAGAFVLSENSLYTREAWVVFLDRLNQDGILSVSRWYHNELPGEIYRIAALASRALLDFKVERPADHIVIVRNMQSEDINGPDGIGTLLLSKRPFSDQELDILERVSAEAQFDITFSPRGTSDPNLAKILSGQDPYQVARSFPINIAPPTDDSPFFFQMLRLRDMYDQALWSQGRASSNMRAVYILGSLLMITAGLTIAFILLPLSLSTRRGNKEQRLKDISPFFVYFLGIGLGFILVEISMLQRLTIFLGHPTFSLSVVLFSLLLSTGAGSYLTRHIQPFEANRKGMIRLGVLLLVVLLSGIVTPPVIETFRAAVTPVRILVAVAILVPLGITMGMAFPLGMKTASIRAQRFTPWFWGINGAASVCGSVLAVVLALTFSISFSYWTGLASYILAFSAFAWIGHVALKESRPKSYQQADPV
jgi:hypothetical protein